MNSLLKHLLKHNGKKGYSLRKNLFHFYRQNGTALLIILLKRLIQ